MFTPAENCKFSPGDPEAPCVTFARRSDGAKYAIPSLVLRGRGGIAILFGGDTSACARGLYHAGSGQYYFDPTWVNVILMSINYG